MIHNYIYEHKALYWEGFQSGELSGRHSSTHAQGNLLLILPVTVVQSLGRVRLSVTP